MDVSPSWPRCTSKYSQKTRKDATLPMTFLSFFFFLLTARCILCTVAAALCGSRSYLRSLHSKGYGRVVCPEYAPSSAVIHVLLGVRWYDNCASPAMTRSVLFVLFRDLFQGVAGLRPCFGDSFIFSSKSRTSSSTIHMVLSYDQRAEACYA